MYSKRTIQISVGFLLVVACFVAAAYSTVSGESTCFSDDSFAVLLNPPPSPIRQVAEFEPMEAVLIRYPFGINYDLIAAMAEDITVVTIVASPSQQNYVINQYINNGVNIDHCSFLLAPSDTYWTRDYGPWFVFNGNNELAVIDFTYSRGYPNRPNDNNIPSVFAANQGLPSFFMPLFHEGGNYMTDGQGIAVSTTLVWEVNPGLTALEIDQIVSEYLGIQTYHVVPDVNGEYIKHVDCWGKYLAPDVILIREVPPGHSQYALIESAVDYFQSQMSCYGTPYTVVRVYTPTNEPYTNSLILNNKVFVPLKGSPWDAAAIASYQNAMPGYEVLGFFGSWHSTDALHCRTIGIPDRFMLYIEHIPLFGNQSSQNGYDIQAKIYPYSGESIIPASTGVYWRIEEQDWNFVSLQSMGNHQYHATIPGQQNGTLVSYYIHAEDASGRAENHPYIGAENAYVFTAYGDVYQNTPPERPQRPSGPANGKAGTTYLYSTSTSDADSDVVFYLWDWGDGTTGEWLGPNASGAVVSASHVWSEEGTYLVRVKAKDVHDAESDWSDPLAVTMPKSSVRALVFLERLQRLFPNVYLFFFEMFHRAIFV